jgi:malate dehydrogenase (oxaloacetate-decarboxylating)(NADP+)
MGKNLRKKEALEYHSLGRPGKIEVVPTKKTKTQRDLALAYSPGVADPCLEIEKNPEDAYKYTTKGNLVAVISNGTAVLGLGDIGALASKPVMEGKGLLFKIYADIDVFDIEVDENNVDDFIKVVKAIAPTFGGINLEDIKAPESFEIERRLIEELDIPVMHDDQHGTAIISSAALLNALEIQEKKIDEVKIVVSGAGASAIACTGLYLKLGVKKENVFMFDSKGLLSEEREGLGERKQFYVNGKNQSLEEALVGADVFLGLSKGNLLNAEMIGKMAPRPIVFALANPTPEIDYPTAIAAREDIIMATGRSDYPNQVNNVLGFPYIFRGALDVRASKINDDMKLAAVKALAELTKESVPDVVNMVYQQKALTFGPEYIIPKPMDPRLLSTIAPAVAKAAHESGVAKQPIKDFEAYREELFVRLGQDDNVLRLIMNKARQHKKKVVFSEAENVKILKAAQQALEDEIAIPILLGNRKRVRKLAEEYSVDVSEMEIIDPKEDAMSEKREAFGNLFYEKRKRKGYNKYEAIKIMRERNYFGCMMVETGEADALITGLARKYPDTIRPALEIIGPAERPSTANPDKVQKISGMYAVLTKKGPICYADTTITEFPTAEELVDITLQASDTLKSLNIQPKVAMLSYSNFGSSNLPEAKKIRKAVEIMHKKYPEMQVEGEVQGSIAFNKELLKENYPFSSLVDARPNVLIFPNLSAGNIAYNLQLEMGNQETIGPIILGLKKSVHVLQLGSTVRQIVNMVAIAVLDAHVKQKNS